MNMSHHRDPKLVAVYRMFQFTRESPCLLGTPCGACQLYAQAKSVEPDDYYYRREQQYVCERATPAKPAFYVTRRQAFQMLFDRLAALIHEGWALQLTFSVVTNLRDVSSKADERLVFAYLAGSVRARIAIYQAWSAPPPSLAASIAPSAGYPFV